MERTIVKYSEKLKDPRWQKKRLKILKRDRFQCKCCLNKERMLSIHHLYYLKNADPWEYPNKALITLCQDCHDKAKYIDFSNLWRRRLKLRIIDNKDLVPDFIIKIVFKVFKLKSI
jgi:5-methylcytosine-specific restriction endonuclease McrA